MIGPIETDDWQALLNIKAFIRDMEENNSDGKYLERIKKYQSIYNDGIKYYYKY